ncbi:MAG: hypothetical protein U9O96_07485 [Candidatus Thermoplasmatota archaeon]|nr:hypothetical protein [Candidatus Thermoplasmatota archaeon]
MINPYVTGFPADPKSFEGRKGELGEIKNHLKRLVEKNLVVKINRGRYKFYHPLFREYLERIK